MRLSANAVKFVFNKELVRHCARDVRKIYCGRGQHKFDRVKQTHAYVLQIVCPRAHSRFSNVTQQHIDLRHTLEWLCESARDRVFDQTLPQSNSQITTE